MKRNFKVALCLKEKKITEKGNNLDMKKIINIVFIAMIMNASLGVWAGEILPTDKAQPKDKIKIDIISDVVCPWCAIGYKRLSTAINELDIKDQVDIQWHPFQLNPDMPQEGKNADEYLSAKLGLSPQGLIQKRKNVTKTGKDSGFTFNYFADMRKPNTFNAHVLLDYAREFDKQTELKVRLQEAYFSEQKNIGNREVLYRELVSVGLNADEAIARLDNTEMRKRVQDEENFWKSRGVSSIPTMVFNNKIGRRGANSVDSYKVLLTQLLHLKND